MGMVDVHETRTCLEYLLLVAVPIYSSGHRDYSAGLSGSRGTIKQQMRKTVLLDKLLNYARSVPSGKSGSKAHLYW